MTQHDSMHEMRESFIGNFFNAMFLEDLTHYPLVICGTAQANTVLDATKRLIDKPVMSFAGEKQRLILNKVNYCFLVGQLGPDERSWFGRTINIRRHYMPKCGAICDKNTVSVRVATPPGTNYPSNLKRVVGQPWPYDTDEPKDRPITTTPVRPQTIADDVLSGLPVHEREAYFMAWIEFCAAEQPDWLDKISVKVGKMLAGEAADRVNQLIEPTSNKMTPTQQQPLQQDAPPTPPPAEPPPATNNMPTEATQWITGIEALSASESCIEFRQQVLPDCPEAIRAEVETALANKELSLAGETQ